MSELSVSTILLTLFMDSETGIDPPAPLVCADRPRPLGRLYRMTRKPCGTAELQALTAGAI